MTSTTTRLDVTELQGLLASHLSHYRSRKPFYQADMLGSLFDLGLGKSRRLLDVGGGTGVIAKAMAHFIPEASVVSIDLIDRFCEGLGVETRQYDGQNIPFADGHFDAATLNNVLHHVPVDKRAALLREIRRVVDGPLFIKDHIGGSKIADWRLATLDAIGNIPFGGMVWAQYLSQREWETLARESGYRIAAVAPARAYRKGLMAAVFPNRLETTMRFDPA